jgi:hypothetical protein
MNNLEIFAFDSGKLKIDIKYIVTAPNVFNETIVENDIVTSNGVIYNSNEYENSNIVSINRQPLSTSNDTSKKVTSITFSNDKTMLYDKEQGKLVLTPITTLSVLTTPYNTFKKDSTGNYIWSKMIEFQINSKQLLSNYFEGINGKSIAYIYDYIQKCGFEIREEDFFNNAKLTDADFKIDIFLTQKEFNIIIDIYKDSSKNLIGILPAKTFDNKDNKGIEFGGNRKIATLDASYLKLYNKFLEMTNKSFIFKNQYLSNCEFENLIRWEFTLKNKAHFAKFGIVNSVGNVMNLLDTNQKLFREVSNSIHNVYLNEPKTNNLIVTTKGLDAMEIYQTSLVTAYIELGKSEFDIVEIINNNLQKNGISYSTIKRHKRDIKQIIRNIEKDKTAPISKKLKQNTNVNLTLDKVGFLKS